MNTQNLPNKLIIGDLSPLKAARQIIDDTVDLTTGLGSHHVPAEVHLLRTVIASHLVLVRHAETDYPAAPTIEGMLLHLLSPKAFDTSLTAISKQLQSARAESSSVKAPYGEFTDAVAKAHKFLVDNYRSESKACEYVKIVLSEMSLGLIAGGSTRKAA